MFRALPFYGVCSVLLLLAACSGAPSSTTKDKAGFYSYVDAQGNLITVPKAPAESANQSNISPTKSRSASGLGGAFEGAFSPENAATNPNELWAADEQQYMTSDDFDALLEKKERERFVSYPDEFGRVTTRQVDMVAAREAASERSAFDDESDEQALESVELSTQWSEVRADCCVRALTNAQVLKVGQDLAVGFAQAPRQSVELASRHPAKAFEVADDAVTLQLQSWYRDGYAYPQILFLDDKGMPLARVDQMFTRFKEKTWSSQSYLIGEIPVEPGAKWVVLFLEYAHLDDVGKIVQDKALLRFGDEDKGLAIRGELVIRATNGTFE
ncbi:MAG: hypothetical protein P1U67_04065 [Alcanivoracaceae bacterium]|nr:hypothetical protein [Alcanivoracaceae bacterium]